MAGALHEKIQSPSVEEKKKTAGPNPGMKKVLPDGKELSKVINIYLTIDEHNINSYFNPHDPAPIYMRQLSHEMIQYINATIVNAKRYSVVFYRLKCTNAVNRQYAEPLMYAVRGHFEMKKNIRQTEFEKFKKRTWIMLALSLVVVILCHVISTFLLDTGYTITKGLNNGLDIFSWVILWRPIDKLLFQWNPHLKDICILDKLASAEALITDYEN